MTDKRHAPATLRNREPIRRVLAELLTDGMAVLEIGSGTGEHAAAFAGAFPGVTWQPSDPDPAGRASIAAWAAEADSPNLCPPVDLDVTAGPLPAALEGGFDLVLAVNLIHIAPWAVCPALMGTAARALRPGGRLMLYGPFKVDGAHTAPSNAAFDAQLRLTDPDYGVRDLDAVTAAAAGHGLAFARQVAMPSNNLSVIYQRAGGEANR
ncbi:MAG: DUF938 domain-containing protein [Alphaproteobacteria bacterium]|jgi:SAM-dependent methyltransferase|nr:DUF938 domain-containing protein [Alphaproteobacteria bacterium]